MLYYVSVPKTFPWDWWESGGKVVVISDGKKYEVFFCFLLPENLVVSKKSSTFAAS